MAIASPRDDQPHKDTSSALLADGTPAGYREPSGCSYRLTACLYPACICWVQLVSHYARDLPGTLENEIEAAFDISRPQFQALNAAYFAPNLILPVIAGAVAQLYGAGRVFVACAAVAALGHCLLGYAAGSLSYGAFLAGRVVLGATYEAFDVLAFPLMASHYTENWGLIVGINSSCLRLGSALTFAISPALYNAAGLDAALWVSSGLGVTGLAAACLGMCFLEKKIQFFHRPSDAATRGAEGDRRGGLCSAGGGCELGVELESLTSPRSINNSPEASNEGSGEPGCGMTPRAFGSLLLYSAIGMLFYSALMPFWFYGGAFIRRKWGYSLEAADGVMLIPESTEMVLAVVAGLLVDRLRLGAQARVRIMAACILLFAGSLLALAFLPAEALAPVVPMAALGVGYAMNNTTFWSLCSTLIPGRYLAVGSGILGGAVNIGATILPMLMANSESGQVAISWLASSALLAAVLACVLQHVLGEGK